MKIHPLGRRPRSFYGFEDHYGTEEPEVTQDRIDQAQRNWDNQFMTLPIWKRFLSYLFGEVTEPLFTHAGVSYD